MKNVLDSFSSLPRLLMGTASSFVGTITGTELGGVPLLQALVWIASIFAATATGALALYRLRAEIKNMKNKDQK